MHHHPLFSSSAPPNPHPHTSFFSSSFLLIRSVDVVVYVVVADVDDTAAGYDNMVVSVFKMGKCTHLKGLLPFGVRLRLQMRVLAREQRAKAPFKRFLKRQWDRKQSHLFKKQVDAYLRRFPHRYSKPRGHYD